MPDLSSAKQQYVRELELSRAALRRDWHCLCDEANVVKKMQKAVQRRPLVWLSGATLLGFVLAGRRRAPKAELASRGWFRRHKKDQGSRSLPGRVSFWGLLLGLLKVALPLLRPVVSAYTSKKLTELALTLGR